MHLYSKCTLIAIVIVASAAQLDASEEIYVVDSSHTSVVFNVSHYGYSYTYGRFNQAKGGFVLDSKNPKDSQFQFIINANSVDTNDRQRDQQIKGPDFLNVKQFDVISFQSTKVRVEKKQDEEIYHIQGKLTMCGVTRKVTLPVKKLGEGLGPQGMYRSGFICKTELKRSDFGMKNMIPQIGDEVGIIVSFEGVRQDAPASESSVAVSISKPKQRKP